MNGLLIILLLQGMKDMYEWIQLMTKARLYQISIIRRLEHSQPSSLTGQVQSDIIGRSISPRPHYCYYSTPLITQWRPGKTPYPRPLSSCSNENGSCLNYPPICKEQKRIHTVVSHVKNKGIPISYYDTHHTRRNMLKITQKYPIYLKRSMGEIHRSKISNFPEKYFDNLVTLLRESASNV